MKTYKHKLSLEVIFNYPTAAEIREGMKGRNRGLINKAMLNEEERIVDIGGEDEEDADKVCAICFGVGTVEEMIDVDHFRTRKCLCQTDEE